MSNERNQKMGEALITCGILIIFLGIAWITLKPKQEAELQSAIKYQLSSIETLISQVKTSNDKHAESVSLGMVTLDKRVTTLEQKKPVTMEAIRFEPIKVHMLVKNLEPKKTVAGVVNATPLFNRAQTQTTPTKKLMPKENN